MSCLIEVDYEYGDSPDFFRVAQVVARKAHRCCECGREIQKAERYEYAAGRWDGIFQVFKTCADCLSVRQLFCGQPALTDLYSSLWDEICESDGGEHIANNLGPLTVAARQKVCGLLEKYWGENNEFNCCAFDNSSQREPDDEEYA